MDLDIEDLYKTWSNLVKSTLRQEIIICPFDYPNRLESTINRAVELKRCGQFEKAIETYLNIFVDSNAMYPAVMDMMYKSVICSGRIDFAYEVIVFAEVFAKLVWGPVSPLGPWVQETRRKELEQVMIACSDLPTSFISNGEPTQEQKNNVIENIAKRNNLLEEIMEKYAGGAKVSIPWEINDYLEQAYDTFIIFRQNGVIKDSINYEKRDEKESLANGESEKKASGKTMKYYMKAVGVTFENRQRVISRLKPGQPLRFVLEPTNPYDCFAVRIETLSGEQVGYISKDHNQDVFNNMKNGKAKYEPVVSAVTGGGFSTQYGLNIEVTMTELR